MPFGSVTLKPGIDVEHTPTALQAGYFKSSLGRFRAGLFEKLGGFVKFFPFALGGVPRAVAAWLDLNASPWTACGTTTALDVINSGTLTNITPQTFTSDFSPNFSTTNTSPLVSIVDPNIANVTTYDSVFFNTPVSIDGLILSGAYSITTILSSTSYQITAATNAGSTVPNAGTVPSFTTTNGSALVNVTLASHGLIAGNSIVFPIATSVGGLTIQGTYSVVSVTSSSVFVISATTTATSGTTASMNSGNAEIVYYITIGPVAAGTGYSFGGYSSGPYSGTGATSGQQTGTNITATDWTLDNWAATLISCPANGGIYAWTPGSGVGNTQLVPTAPFFNSGAFVAAPYQILIVYGSTITKTIGVAQDPLTWRASDLSDYTFWQTNVVNPSRNLSSQAFQSRIPTGTAIKAGMATPNQVLLWTDLDLWSCQYVNLPTIWTQAKIGANCGTVSRHSVTQLGGAVYWMGRNNFFALAGGAPISLPCTVWDTVFQNLDANNLDKCWAVSNTGFNEVWFFYPSASGNTGQCDSYAKVNVVDGTWDYGPTSPTIFARAAGIDKSVAGNPLWATPTGILYTQETGYDADGQPMTPSFTSGYFYLGEGQEFVVVDQVIPDMKWGTFAGSQNAQVQISFNVINYPGDPPTTYGPFTMTSTTENISVRFRGRQMSVTVASADVGSFWRLGHIRWRWASSGRR